MPFVSLEKAATKPKGFVSLQKKEEEFKPKEWQENSVETALSQYEENVRQMKEEPEEFAKRREAGTQRQLKELEEQEKGAIEGVKTAGELAVTIPLMAAGGIVAAPLVNLASKVPYLATPLSAAANLLGIGLAGATYETGKDVLQGKPIDLDDITAHGVMWAAIDAGFNILGKTAAFSKRLYDVARNAKTPVNDVLKDVTATVEEYFARSGIPKDKIDPQKAAAVADNVLNSFEQQTLSSERAALEGKPVEVNKEQPFGKGVEPPNPLAPSNNPAIKAVTDAEAQGIPTGPKPFHEFHAPKESDVAFGKDVQKGIEEYIERQEEKYKPLYKRVEEQSKYITGETEAAAKELQSIMSEERSLTYRHKDFDQFVKQHNNALYDLGYSPIKGKNGKPLKNKDGTFVGWEKTKEVPASDVLKLKRRMNKTISFEDTSKYLQNKLKKVPGMLSDSVSASLEKHAPKAQETFQEAEKIFAETAQTLEHPHIEGIHRNPTPELIESALKNPSVFNTLKGVVTPEQLAKVEKRILGKIAEATETSARKLVRNYEPFLSPHAAADAKALLKEKASTVKPIAGGFKTTAKPSVSPHKASVQKELDKAIDTGQAPSKTLELFKTERGKAFVKDALKDNPKKKEIIKYLNEKTIENRLKTVIDKNGTIETEKLGDLLKNKSFQKEVLEAYGPKGFKALEDLHKGVSKLRRVVEQTKKHAEVTAKRKQKVETPYLERWENLKKNMENLGPQGQHMGQSMLGSALGYTLGLKKTLALGAGSIALNTFLKSPTAQKALREAIKAAQLYKVKPERSIIAFEAFLKAMDEETSE